MRNIFAITAACLMIAAAAPTYASSSGDLSCATASGQQQSVEDISAKVSGMGYVISKVDRENGCFEVYAIDKQGARVEIYLHPVTGEILKSKKRS